MGDKGVSVPYPTYRRRDGNTLAMIAVFAIFLIIVALCLVLYMSMIRSNTEHRTAIESAAIAAAKDISRIIINTPEFGYVGLTTEAPVGSATAAPDGYCQEVRSLNELMATARLDMIIADQLGDNFAKRMALADYNNVKKVKDDLITALRAAILPGGSGRDSAGNAVTPYLSAERVYLRNQAKGSTYVAGSMRLSIGGLLGGIETSTQAPVPLSKGACAGHESNGRYLSDQSVPFQGTDFVFGSVARRVSLCENSKYRDVVPGLPFQMPAVIKVDATQRFQDQGKTWTTTFSACACAGSAEPPRPAPGALTLSFPDGPIPEMVNPGDVITTVGGATMDIYESTGGDFNKDRPASTLAPFPGSIPFTTNPPSAVEVAELAFYDWVRCGGSRVNIDSILALQTMPFNAPSTSQTMWRAEDPTNPGTIINLGNIPTGVMHIYTFNQDGTIRYRSRDIKPYPYTVVSDHQFYAEFQENQSYLSDANEWTITGVRYVDRNGTVKTDGEIKGTKKFDMFVRDQARVLGTTSGGKHGGERMDGNPLISLGAIKWGKSEWPVATLPMPEIPQFDSFGEGGGSRGSSGSSSGSSGPITGTSSSGSAGRGAPPMISRQDDFASSTVPTPPILGFTTGSGNAPRPTWNRDGLACDIRFRRQLKVGDLAYMIGGVQTGYVGEMR